MVVRKNNRQTKVDEKIYSQLNFNIVTNATTCTPHLILIKANTDSNQGSQALEYFPHSGNISIFAIFNVKKNQDEGSTSKVISFIVFKFRAVKNMSSFQHP